MAEFQVNTYRLDPYKAFQFRVYFGTNTQPVAAVSKISALKRANDVIEYKEGGNANILAGLGRVKSHPQITLERGISHDLDFYQWATAPFVLVKGSPVVSLKNLRRNIRIELMNE